MLHPSDRVFMRRLLDRITEEAQTRVGYLATGCASDFADYRNRCGYIQALDNVREWCREIAESDEANPQQPR